MAKQTLNERKFREEAREIRKIQKKLDRKLAGVRNTLARIRTLRTSIPVTDAGDRS